MNMFVQIGSPEWDEVIKAAAVVGYRAAMEEKKKSSTIKSINDTECYAKEEVMELLKCSESTLARIRKNGYLGKKIKFIRAGKEFKYFKSSIDNLFK